MSEREKGGEGEGEGGGEAEGEGERERGRERGVIKRLNTDIWLHWSLIQFCVSDSVH